MVWGYRSVALAFVIRHVRSMPPSRDLDQRPLAITTPCITSAVPIVPQAGGNGRVGLGSPRLRRAPAVASLTRGFRDVPVRRRPTACASLERYGLPAGGRAARRVCGRNAHAVVRHGPAGESGPTSASAPAPPHQPRPRRRPAATATLPPGSMAMTVTDRLRARSEPRVSGDSVKYEPLLPVGTQLLVIEGPVQASGYDWYHVAPVAITLTGGVADGWVAAADHDGTPWIALAADPLAGLEFARSTVARSDGTAAQANRAATSIKGFALDLYRQLRSDPALGLAGRNIVFSPASIALALAMARAGAAAPRPPRWMTCSTRAAGRRSRPHSTRWIRSSRGTTPPGPTTAERRMPCRSGSPTRRSGSAAGRSSRASSTRSRRRSAPSWAWWTTRPTRRRHAS